MNAEGFWSIIQIAQEKGGSDPWAKRESLILALCDLSAEEIQEFDQLFWILMSGAYRADLWEAAWLVTCGCGDDAFHDFRAWLIGQGQTVYEKTLGNPEAIVDTIDISERFSIYDAWTDGAADTAYKRMVNHPLLDSGYQEEIVLIGGTLAGEEKIPEKYPRIRQKFGDCTE